MNKLYTSVKAEPLLWMTSSPVCRSPLSGDRHEDELVRVTRRSSGLLQFTHQCAMLGPSVSSSSVEIFTSALFVLLLLHVSSLLVHIGGPQNALCCLAGYLFVNVILLAMNMLMYSFWDMLCIRYVEMSACTHTAGVYVCMCSAKTQKRQKKDASPQNPQEIASSLTLDPDVPLSLCTTKYRLHSLTHTHTCILYRIKNVPWRNERLTIYFFYVFKGEPSSDVYRKCCNDMKIKILLCVNYSTINCLY